MEHHDSIQFIADTKNAQIMIFICHNVFEPATHEAAWLLLRVIRSYTIIDLFLSFEVHTEETIADGRKEANLFIKLLEVSS